MIALTIRLTFLSITSGLELPRCSTYHSIFFKCGYVLAGTCVSVLTLGYLGKITRQSSAVVSYRSPFLACEYNEAFLFSGTEMDGEARRSTELPHLYTLEPVSMTLLTEQSETSQSRQVHRVSIYSVIDRPPEAEYST
jgi:hypothetical protein